MSSSPTDTSRSTEPRSDDGVEIVMPQMGVSVAEGTIAAWLKQPGEEIGADELICEVSTDKIDVEVPSPVGGVLSEHLVAEGETVAVGTVIAVIGGSEAAPAEADESAAPPGLAAASPTGEGAPRTEPAAAPSETDLEEGEIDRSRFHSPVVRRIAAEKGIDLDRVAGRGIGGRVRKSDLLEHIATAGRTGGGGEDDAGGQSNGHERPLHTESPYRPDTAADPASEAEPTPAPPDPAPTPAGAEDLIGETRREPMDPMRKAIARHMVESRRTAAHCTTVVEADFSAVVGDRGGRKEAMARRGVPLTYLAYVARAAVEGLQEEPILNASVEGEEIVYHDDINLGIAVALPEGLVVPVIRRAQRLSLEGMAAAIAELAKRARGGLLEPDDLVGGTFTITNPGQFGAVIATPIINQPQVAILDLEAITRRAVVIEGPDDGEESIAIRPMSYLCMSWDHRALDGAVSARFLAGLKGRLEQADQGGSR